MPFKNAKQPAGCVAFLYKPENVSRKCHAKPEKENAVPSEENSQLAGLCVGKCGTTDYFKAAKCYLIVRGAIRRGGNMLNAK